jgi:uncharacterized protein
MRILGMFAKQPIAGAVKTRLANDIGAAAATELYVACLHDLLDRFSETGHQRWIGYAPDGTETSAWFAGASCGRYQLWRQPAGDLGVRIEQFFAMAAASASPEAPRTVLIGSDSPTLPRDLIEQAFESLARSDLVLGPAADGGYYLIGGRTFPAGWLGGVRWSTPWTLADTVVAAERHSLSVDVLPLWSDIDTAADLPATWGHLQALRAASQASAGSRCEAWLRRWVSRQGTPGLSAGHPGR